MQCNFCIEREISMKKNKLGKAKYSINQLDANKNSSGVSGTEMSIMYNLSNKIEDMDGVDLEDKRK